MAAPNAGMTAILQAIAQATKKPMEKADQINAQAADTCPTCGQPAPAKPDVTPADPQDDSDTANSGSGQ